jgi:hypothetical protein
VVLTKCNKPAWMCAASTSYLRPQANKRMMAADEVAQLHVACRLLLKHQV